MPHGSPRYTLPEKLASDRLLATFLLIPRLEIIEMLSLAGFDAVVIDLEHGPVGTGDVPVLAAEAQGAGMYAIARVSNNSEIALAQALDAGVDGLLVPHVASAEAAGRVVRAGRFPPAGDRSINPYVRGNRYGRRELNGYEQINARVALIPMLEGTQALGDLGAICEVPDLDAVFVGPVDLSAALGYPGQTEHPDVISAIDALFEHAAAAGRRVGIYAPNPAAAARWFASGAALVALSADSAMTLSAFTAARAAAFAPLAAGVAE